mgnify:CR=1 FL=1
MIQHKEELRQLTQRWLNRKKLTNLSLSLSQKEDDWNFVAGDFQKNPSYFIASTTKLFITALFLQLQAEGRLDLDDRIAKYLEDSILHKLHVWKGKDYSHEISIKHLLSQTSGLADYFEQGPKGQESLRDQLMAGKDRSWELSDVLKLAKSTGAQFSPAYKRKALYSDTNFQLLGHLLEVILDQDLSTIIAERISRPLQMEHTFLFTDPNDQTPVPLQYKRLPLKIPQAMASFGPDGGIVSTSKDMLRFIKAFFDGQLFPVDDVNALKDWRKIFFPLQYGIGLARFRLPRIFTPFSPSPEWIGHSGVSGAFAFYYPQKELYLTGTVNEIHPSSLPFQLMVKLTNIIES